MSSFMPDTPHITHALLFAQASRYNSQAHRYFYPPLYMHASSLVHVIQVTQFCLPR